MNGQTNERVKILSFILSFEIVVIFYSRAELFCSIDNRQL